MRVLLISGGGGGFATPVVIAEGTTAHQMFLQLVKYGRPEDYLIRLNRLPVAADQVLKEGDQISITPAGMHPLTLAGTTCLDIPINVAQRGNNGRSKPWPCYREPDDDLVELANRKLDEPDDEETAWLHWANLMDESCDGWTSEDA